MKQLQMKQIIINFIDPSNQKYDTLGDYTLKDDILTISVSKSKNDKFDHMVALHELVEAILAYHNDINFKVIDEFDMQFEKAGCIGEPGDDIGAPYFHEHHIADVVERLVGTQIGYYYRT